VAYLSPVLRETSHRQLLCDHVVDLIHQELQFREIAVVREEYDIQRDGQYLFAAMVLNWLKTDEFAAALAFRHFNDPKEAMKMCAGVSVFTCDNMALSEPDPQA
jgi:hypothetical protein